MLLTKCGGLVVCHLSLRLQICAKAISRTSCIFRSARHQPVLLPTSTITVLGCVRFLASASQVARWLKEERRVTSNTNMAPAAPR